MSKKKKKEGKKSMQTTSNNLHARHAGSSINSDDLAVHERIFD